MLSSRFNFQRSKFITSLKMNKWRSNIQISILLLIRFWLNQQLCSQNIFRCCLRQDQWKKRIQFSHSVLTRLLFNLMNSHIIKRGEGSANNHPGRITIQLVILFGYRWMWVGHYHYGNNVQSVVNTLICSTTFQHTSVPGL